MGGWLQSRAEQSRAEQSEDVLESKTEMYCSKGTPILYGPQTFNFIAKLNGLGRPPIEAQGGPFNFISRLKRWQFCGCGRAIDLFNLAIKLNVWGPWRIGVHLEIVICLSLALVCL